MVIYVDANASEDGSGEKDRPFRTLYTAAQIAMPGDEVLVAPGIYREFVDPKHAGREDARITYRSEKPLGAVLTGAEEVKDWEHFKGNVWVARINNRVFGSYNPYTTVVGGDWYFGTAVRHTGAVYLNDRQLYEAESLEACMKGEPSSTSWEPKYSTYQWYSLQDGDETVIYANFQGKDPTKEHVEINVRRNCFMPSSTGIGYISVSGFRICKAATTWAPPAAYQDGMIGPHWSKGWIIEDCEISDSRCCGISLGKYRDPENDHYFTRKHVKSPTQMERDAVCRGQYDGWVKEKVGSHIVRRCQIHDCGQAGIVGRMGGAFSLIEENHIHHISTMGEICGAETAGIKLHAAIDVTFRRNHIHDCIMGIWCDWEAQGTRITQNLLHDNQLPKGTKRAEGAMENQDIFIEVGHGPTLIDNNLLLSKVSLRLSSQGVALVHNLCLGSFTSVGLGTDSVVEGKLRQRYTPYHIHHRTEVAGFMTILHGDDRVYNNIFVQNYPVDEKASYEENQLAGTAVFDGYPTYEEWISWFKPDEKADMSELEPYHYRHLPVWIDGNAYFLGAKSWEGEPHHLIDEDPDVYVRLIKKDGTYFLQTNLYEHLKEFRDEIITSDGLGEAFEPEQRFENPDGSSITFDQDYFGMKRGTATIPGPFAEAKDELTFGNAME